MSVEPLVMQAEEAQVAGAEEAGGPTGGGFLFAGHPRIHPMVVGSLAGDADGHLIARLRMPDDGASHAEHLIVHVRREHEDSHLSRHSQVST